MKVFRFFSAALGLGVSLATAGAVAQQGYYQQPSLLAAPQPLEQELPRYPIHSAAYQANGLYGNQLLRRLPRVVEGNRYIAAAPHAENDTPPPPTPGDSPPIYGPVKPHSPVYSKPPMIQAPSFAPMVKSAGKQAPGCSWSLMDRSCCGCWFGGAYGLLMTRDDENPIEQLSFDDANPLLDIMGSKDASMETAGGFEVRLGRWIDDCHAWEVVYWGLFSEDQQADRFATDVAGNLNSSLDFSRLIFDDGGAGVNVDALYNGSQHHRLRREYQFHNVELNLISGRLLPVGRSGSGCCGGGLSLSWNAGLRYFRFEEGFEFATAATDPTFGAAPDDEAIYDIDVENNLLGFQLGCRMDYGWGSRLNFYAAPKFGVYANYMEHQSRIYSPSYGTAVVGPGNPNPGEVWDVDSDKTDVSFTAEINLGVDWYLTPCLKAVVGYRAIAISGVALSTNQIPRDLGDLPRVQRIDSNGSLIVHGLYVGGEYAW